MKILLLFLSIFFASYSSATTYYISPSGNDVTGNGSSANPWRTLFKATSTVSGIGDIIHVNAGTYTETAQSLLKVGVSIEGEGVTSVIRSTETRDFNAIINAISAEGTSGNQHISNLRFDGQNLTTDWAIFIGGRSNFSIHDCSFADFQDRGVTFEGRIAYDTYPSPAGWATGNSFYNNIMNNCGGYNLPTGIYGRGCLNIGGQDGMLIYNNTITQNQRPEGYNGWCIKGFGNGYIRGCKIYNNTLNKIPLGSTNGVTGWDFAIELFHEWGLEIYGNTITGAGIDCNEQFKGSYAYSVWIHDNIITNVTPNVYRQAAITLEFNTEAAIVENNRIDNQSIGVYFTPRSPNTVKDVTIRGNLMTLVDGESGGNFVDLGGEYNTMYYDGINIYNNTMIYKPGYASFFGISLPKATGGYIRNINIKNNILANASYQVISQPGGTSITMDALHITHNDIYSCGSGNMPVYGGSGSGTNYQFSNNINVTPVYGTNYTLLAGSPLIDAGTDVGLLFSGAAPDMGYAEFGGVVNIPPSANAGADETITLPISLVNLAGSGTDPDGTIAAYSWTQVSGPAPAAILNPLTPTAIVSALIQGTYKFELKVTDNMGASGRDTMEVLVNPMPGNIPPTANAGNDQSITLPVSTVNFSGSGTDPDGTITTYLWIKIAGPTGGTITNANAAATTVTGLTAGTYRFELRVTDNNGSIGMDTVQVLVNPAPNVAPTANAGNDQSITLPINTVNLAGSGTDPDGTITAYLWTKVAGPAGGTITNANAAATTVTGLTAGTYRFELRVTDNSGATDTDTMQVIVNTAVNIAPTANAGNDQSITLPINTVNLAGSGTDPDGTITAYLWTKVAGPAATITNPNAAATSVTGLTAGTYRFELRVTDNSGATDTDTMQVIVNTAVNIAPTANAGNDQSITLPINTVNLAGSGTDPDGTITAYLWTKIAGPAATITNPNAAATTVTGLTAGTYRFELRVTDNSGATDTDTMQVIVNTAVNIAPTANAGNDQSITLPINTVNLAGSGTDPDGTITAYLWTKIAGPAATITNPNAAATSVTGLTAGTYRFELRVTDNSGATDTDTMQVLVNPAPNVPPVANAGNDQSITLPVNTVNLSGSGTDADGTITAYLWTKIAGPAGSTITNANAAATSVTALVGGVYRFVLQVTDNSGATDTDTMQVIVFVPNIAPTANAGLNQSITLPTNTASLSGSGNDIDGTIVSYTWTKLSGPSGGIIANVSLASTSISALTAGVYLYELRVIDNNGGIGRDTMQVTVNPANIPPVSNAGPDQSIVLPANSVTLTGSGTDADGTVIGYAWRQISGPVDKLVSLHTPVTVLDNLVAGTYIFELTVTDNKGATDKDTVKVVSANPVIPSQNSIKVYPNPVTDLATLDINRTTNSSAMLVTITDMQGKNIYTKQLSAGSYSIKEPVNMSNISKGVYLITVHFSSQEKQTLKVIKAGN